MKNNSSYFRISKDRVAQSACNVSGTGKHLLQPFSRVSWFDIVYLARLSQGECKWCHRKQTDRAGMHKRPKDGMRLPTGGHLETVTCTYIHLRTGKLLQKEKKGFDSNVSLTIFLQIDFFGRQTNWDYLFRPAARGVKSRSRLHFSASDFLLTIYFQFHNYK